MPDAIRDRGGEPLPPAAVPLVEDARRLAGLLQSCQDMAVYLSALKGLRPPAEGVHLDTVHLLVSRELDEAAQARADCIRSLVERCGLDSLSAREK